MYTIYDDKQMTKVESQLEATRLARLIAKRDKQGRDVLVRFGEDGVLVFRKRKEREAT